MTIEYKLITPVEQGQEIYEILTLREPTGKEIRKIGIPVSVATKEINMEAVCQYISVLAAVPPSVVNKMIAKDIIQMTPIIVSFFGDADGLI